MAVSTPREEREAKQEKRKRWFELQMEKTWFQVLLLVGGVALYLLLGLILWLILDQYIDPRKSTVKKDLIQALGLLMAGAAGVIGVYFTWRGQRLTHQAHEENQQATHVQLKNAQEQLNITRESQITDRFTRAIDQLGESSDDKTPKLEVRLGGI